jgi:ribosome-binding protein aMBF1 (putative translation factor)
MPPRSVRGFRALAVRTLREQRGLSLAQLGVLIGVDRSQVWQWETGRKVPTPAHLLALAQALEADPYELFDADPDQPTLHDLRVRLGLSAKDLATAAEVPYEGTVHPLDVGRGPAEVNDDIAWKLARVLQVELNDVRTACARSRESLLNG